MPTALQPFENHQVVGTSITLKNAGDGLSAALKIDPAEYEHGEPVFVVVETKVAKVSFVPSKDDPENMIRHHELATVVATPVEGGKVKAILAAHRKKLEAAEGISKLPGLDETEAGD
jgi:hypothetical protein